MSRLWRVVRLLLGNIAVFLALLLVVALAAEIWARTRPPNWFVTFDPLLGFRLRSNVEGRYRGLSFIDPNPDIDTPVKLNSQGMRGPERSIEKPPGIQRVMILGDSFVQAFEVPYEDAFYARMDARAAREGVPLETVPVGTMGWGTAQEYLWLREEGLAWEPDLVVVLFFVFNDQFDNSMVLNTNRGRPYFELRDGELELVSLPDHRNRFKYFVAEHFRSARIWTEVAQRVRPAFEGLRALGVVDTRPPPSQTEGYDQMVLDAFDLTFALIEETREFAEAHGSRFLLAWHGKRELRGEVTSSELVEAFCEESGIDCLDLNRFTAGREEYFVPRDHHWTSAGHAVVADALYEAARRSLARPADAEPDS